MQSEYSDPSSPRISVMNPGVDPARETCTSNRVAAPKTFMPSAKPWMDSHSMSTFSRRTPLTSRMRPSWVLPVPRQSEGWIMAIRPPSSSMETPAMTNSCHIEVRDPLAF